MAERVGLVASKTFLVPRDVDPASVVSNIGTWMHTVGASWLMTTLAASPLLVALVQTATTLPVFLLATCRRA